MVKKHIAKTIEEYEKTRANPSNDGGSGPIITRGTVNVKGCSHKTFMNGKPHPFNGMEGVVGLRRWIEKVEQVFEICMCAEEDKVMFADSTFEGRALTWWNGNGDDIEAYNNRFHELALMCPDLVPNEKKNIKSFDVIVGMDWLSYHRAVIVCYEKIVRIPLPNDEILEIQGERPEKDPRSLSCIKADEKKLDDIRIVHDFPKVFPDDLTGLPPVREIEFRIDLILGALLVIKSPYRLAPSEMLELSNQLKELQEKGFIRPSHSPWGAPVLFMEASKVENALADAWPGLANGKEGRWQFILYGPNMGSFGRKCKDINYGRGSCIKKALGTRLDMSTTYHPQTNRQSEHAIQTLKDMLRACVIDFGCSWDTHLPLAEFSFNNSYHSGIRCAPFEALYGRKCISPILWAKIGESQLIGPEMV
ncbi:putative reverse transcriptase domain-containing protein [Tanacetum coccineum]